MRWIVSVLLIIPILLNWWLVWIPAVLWISLRYGAAPFIFVGLLLDGYFGHYYTWPILTVSALLWYWLVTISRPYIMTNTEMV